MDGIKKTLATLFWSTVGWIWSHSVIPWLVVVLGPILTGWVAHTEGLNWSEVLLKAQLAFAGCSVGAAGLAVAIYYIDLQVGRRSLKGKLQFGAVRFGKNIAGPGVFLGFQVANTSEFPIEFNVDVLRTRIGSSVPTRTNFTNRKVVVAPKGVGWFDDHVIDSPGSGTLDGLLEYEIKYGPPDGKLKFDLKQRKAVTVVIDGEGNLTSASWYEAS